MFSHYKFPALALSASCFSIKSSMFSIGSIGIWSCRCNDNTITRLQARVHRHMSALRLLLRPVRLARSPAAPRAGVTRPHSVQVSSAIFENHGYVFVPGILVLVAESNQVVPLSGSNPKPVNVANTLVHVDSK